MSSNIAEGDNFTGSATSTSPGASLKCSSFNPGGVKSVPFAGVYFDNQNNNLHIGSLSSSTNTYDRMEYGVYLKNSMARIFNSRFGNLAGAGITQFPAPPPIGIGVYSINSYSSAIHQVHTEGNTFTNVYRGVHVEGINNYLVLNSRFSVNQTSPNFTGNAAVFATNTVDAAIIQDNTVHNFNTGFYHGYSTPSAAANFTMSVFQNTITALGTAAAYCAEGISLDDGINSFNASGRRILLSSNSLSTVQTGIRVTNFKYGLRISNNTIGIHSMPLWVCVQASGSTVRKEPLLITTRSAAQEHRT